MCELHWTPEQLGRLTLPQFLCLVSETPPGAARRAESVDAWQEAMARRQSSERQADREWSERQ